MQDSNIPAKFPKPFGANAGAGYIRPIPTASQIGVQNGAASLTDGFPPNCFIPVAGGGSWPFGQDMNGLLNQATAWNQWQQAGGPVGYDATFSAAIGGYPKGAILASATLGGFWLSTADNNTTDPDTGGAGWVPLYVTGTYAVDSGTTNTLAITLNPAPASLASLVGVPIRVQVATGNVGASTLNVNSLGAVWIRNPDGTDLLAGQLAGGSMIEVVYGGAVFRLIGGSAAIEGTSGAFTGNVSAGTGLFANVLVFSTAGTTNWTVPPGVTKIAVRIWGGGGGGGAVYIASGVAGAGGGGGGGYGEGVFAVTPGAVLAITVGAGGTAGTVSGSTLTGAGSGQSSSVGALITANGAGPGISNVGGGTGGAGATSTGGSIILGGQQGASAINNGALAFGGGGGGTFGSSAGYLSAAGGTGASFPGGGGGGAAASGGGNNGQPGGGGLVIISW